jgi:hypothetical protein
MEDQTSSLKDNLPPIEYGYRQDRLQNKIRGMISMLQPSARR